MKATNNYSLRDNLKFGVTAAAKALPNTPVLLRNQPYRQLFAQAKELGYDELELHLRVPEDGGITELIALEEEFGLGISAVATGQSRGLDHLCLIDPSPEIRRKAVERMKQFIDWASAVSCRGVILGNIRGNLPLGNQQELLIPAVGNDLTAISAVIYGEVVGVLQLQAAHHGEVVGVGGLLRGRWGLVGVFRGRHGVVRGGLAARAQGQRHGQGQQRRRQPVQILFHHVLSFVGRYI